MRTRLLATVACWLGLTALVPAQPINPGAEIKLPAYIVPEKDAEPDCAGGPDLPTFPTFFFGLEGLYWHGKPGNVDRAIVGTLANPNLDYNAFAGAGSLADPNTRVLFGNQEVLTDNRWGFRGTAQIGFGDTNTDVLELVGMYLPRTTDRFEFLNPAVALLYTNVTGGQPGTPSAIPVAGLVGGNLLVGGVRIGVHSDIWGAEGSWSHRFHPRNSHFYGEFLLGYRHFGMYEGLGITSGQQGAVFEDSFKTTNFFSGAQVGTRLGVKLWHFCVSTTIKSAIGINDESLYINSRNYNSALGNLYVQETNYEKASASRMAYLFEMGANCSWAITPNVTLTGGYNYLYLNRVMRATNQIDTNINFNQNGVLTDPANPIRRNAESSFWLQGATFALEFIF